MRNNISELRGAVNQADFAEAIGVSRQTVSSIETGRYDPSLPLAFKIAAYFGKTIEEIFHAD